jgi:hypothetical protein
MRCISGGVGVAAKSGIVQGLMSLDERWALFLGQDDL